MYNIGGVMTVKEAIQILNELDANGELGVYVQREGNILPCNKIYLDVNSEYKILIIE